MMKVTRVLAAKRRVATLATLALVTLAIGVTAAVADGGVPESDATLMNVSSCNSQDLADGTTVYWTSAHQLVPYTIGAPLEVVVKWWRDSGDAGTEIGVGLRGGGFSPSGVSGEYLDLEEDGMLHAHRTGSRTGEIYAGGEPATSAANCDPLIEGASSNTATFYFKFTALHKQPRKPNQKGNAQMNVTLSVGGQRVVLGTNVHVLTAEDQA